ncbi:hypothetical protein [Scytonema sp. HK-05]|uniref:hypothetical protein n=1 Tax=Scytonema sp. HK-05 TaxID=1137095 RepID=UPI000A7CBFFF|nr:hypothetical protein [Scytonema sp. HK-05]
MKFLIAVEIDGSGCLIDIDPDFADACSFLHRFVGIYSAIQCELTKVNHGSQLSSFY